MVLDFKTFLLQWRKGRDDERFHVLFLLLIFAFLVLKSFMAASFWRVDGNNGTENYHFKEKTSSFSYFCQAAVDRQMQDVAYSLLPKHARFD
jgi:hypothetical protein